jgi:hypothetical protein
MTRAIMHNFRSGTARAFFAAAFAPLIIALLAWVRARASLLLASYAAQPPLATCAEARAAAARWLSALPADIAFEPALMHSGGHSAFGLLPPAWAAPVVRYGALSDASRAPESDGAKLLLDVRGLAAPCVIYSLGGNQQTEFEEAMLDATACTVWTFDCTVKAAAMAPLIKRARGGAGRFSFRPYCIGGIDGNHATIKGETIALRSVASIMAELGHTRVDLLKMDIEGAEHYALPAFLAATVPTALPAQVALELHWQGRALESLSVVRDLVRAGYVLASREDNAYCTECSEVTFVRCG